MSQQLPKTSTTYKYIHGPESFAEVGIQAMEEFLCLSDLEADQGKGLSGKIQLAQYGYENWLKNIEDDDDRVRLIGFLRLIIELAEELAEE